MSSANDDLHSCDGPFDTATHADLGLMQGFPPSADKRVDATNGLWVPPFNRWAYQNMRRLLPTAPIEPSERVRPLRRATDGQIDLLPVRREDGSSVDFDTFLRETFTDSFVVLREDTIVWERYLNGMTATTPHQMMSCTKSFVGLFAMKAVDDGLVAETDLVGGLLPELADGAFGSASLGQVLDMTSSMAFNEDYADPAADIHDYAKIIGLGPGSGAEPAADNLHDYLETMTVEASLGHGDVFHYQTPKTDVANWVTNRLTGVGLVEALGQLWKAFGGAGEAYMLLDPAGAAVAGGGLNATPDDLARFAAMILNDGSVGGESVIPANVLDEIATGGSASAFLAGSDAVGVMTDGHWSYRAKWWVRNTPSREAMMAIGVNGQWIYCDRSRRVAVIKQSSQPVAVDPYFDDYTINAIDAIVDALADGPQGA